MKSRSIWRSLLILVLACGTLSARMSADGKMSWEEKLKEKIRSSGAEIGLAFKDLETGESFFFEAREMMHAASTMKVPVMIEVFKQAEQKKFSLDDAVPIKNEFRSIVDGSQYTLDPEDDSDPEIYQLIGKKMKINKLVFRMITLSSNLATNLLVELVDAKNIMATLADLGADHMQVLRGVEDGKAYEKGLNNSTDAYDMMLVMESIATGKAGSTGACREMLEILSKQKFRARIPAGIPEGVRVANKTGSITQIDHDAAIVFPEARKPYVLVVLTRGIDDHKQAEKLIAALSAIVYEHMTGAKAYKD